MGYSFSSEELHHYSRHFHLPGVGLPGQQRLAAAKVLFVGAGGLGSPALLYLAAAGIGTLGIIDADTVEISNLHRQVLYSYQDVGKKKVDAARERLQAMNPAIQIIPHNVRLSPDNAEKVLCNYDIIADGSDNFATSYLINDSCSDLKKPWIYAGISQFEGQCTLFSGEPSSPCLRCLFETIPEGRAHLNCAETGVLGVLPGIMGSIQATEILKWILNLGDSLVGRLLMFDALRMQFREVKIERNPDCVSCSCSFRSAKLLQSEANSSKEASMIDELSVMELSTLQQQDRDFLLLDVREPFEYDICHLGGKLMPLKSLLQRISELDKNKLTIVYCRSGGRSRQAVEMLKLNGFDQVYNLSGGILAWIEKIDPTMRRY